MARSSNITMCSFCGKSHSEVKKLIAGPGVYICDNCITICRDILDKVEHGPLSTALLAVKAVLCILYFEHPEAAKEIGAPFECLVAGAPNHAHTEASR